MKKAWVISCLVLLAFLTVGPLQAAPKAPEAPLGTAAFLTTLSLETDGPAICQGSSLFEPKLQTLFDIDSPKPESCFPAECGFGAPPGCPTTPGCCRQKCCVC